MRVAAHKTLFITFFILSSALFGICQTAENSDSLLDFSKIKSPEIIKTFENAKIAGKPVVLIFDAEWCQYCKMLNEETLKDAAVERTLTNYEKLNVNVDENEADAEIFKGKPRSYGGNGIPAIIIFSPEGEELDRLTGFSDAKNFNAFLKKNLKKLRERIQKQS